ncbi:MAG: hypothetical protein Q7U45_01320, partial [Burkholderiaceae bacterium]|nr:hypothetical protein [Burkholderiaceae bacterium]
PQHGTFAVGSVQAWRLPLCKRMVKAAVHLTEHVFPCLCEVFPLLCAICGGQMRIIAFVTHSADMRARPQLPLHAGDAGDLVEARLRLNVRP